jgi:hypothetical protein
VIAIQSILSSIQSNILYGRFISDLLFRSLILDRWAPFDGLHGFQGLMKTSQLVIRVHCRRLLGGSVSGTPAVAVGELAGKAFEFFFQDYAADYTVTLIFIDQSDV